MAKSLHKCNNYLESNFNAVTYAALCGFVCFWFTKRKDPPEYRFNSEIEGDLLRYRGLLQSTVFFFSSFFSHLNEFPVLETVMRNRSKCLRDPAEKSEKIYTAQSCKILSVGLTV